jgi:hypothetical protein
MSNESKALELAERLSRYKLNSGYAIHCHSAAAELRRQHAEIESLRAQLAARVPDGCVVADVGFRWDGERQHHVPKLVVEFEPVPENSPWNAKGWKDRDAVAAMLSAAPSQQAPQQQVPDGWKLVPVEPTREMRNAAIREQELHRNMSLGLYGDEPASAIYRAMLSAAPSQQAPHPGSQAEYEQWSRDGSPIPDTHQAPVQGEPVAWRLKDPDPQGRWDWVMYQRADFKQGINPIDAFPVLEPLFTHPQQASKQMTDEIESALEALVNRCNNDAGLTNDEAVIAAEAALEQLYKARAVERHHKIGDKQ